MGSGDGGKSGMSASPLGQKNKNRNGPPPRRPPPLVVVGGGGKTATPVPPVEKKNKNRPAPPNGVPFLLCVWIERGLRDVRSCVCKHFFLTLLILLLFLEPLVNGL